AVAERRRAEPAHQVGGTAAEGRFGLDAAADADVRANAAYATAQLEHLAGADRNGRVRGRRTAGDGRARLRARQRDHRRRTELQARPGERGLEPGGSRVVADDVIAERERLAVHGAGRWHSDV